MINQDNSNIIINYDKISVEIAVTEGIVRGISRVSYDGIPLRNTDEYIFPQIATPDGLEVCDYIMQNAQVLGDEVVITAVPRFRVAHRMEWAEHGGHLRVNTGSWSKPLTPDGTFFRWHFKPVNETFDGIPYTGFSYAYEYESPVHHIYQIEDKATWEIGGGVNGNTFIMRNTFTQSIVTFTEDDGFYSGWEMEGIVNPHIFQHLPYYTSLQGFTFQEKDKQVLITAFERPSHIRSLFEKSQNGLLHFHQHCFNLTGNIKTPAQKVMFARTDIHDKVALYNHYLEARDCIQEKIRKYYHITLDETRPGAHVETWDIAKKENFGAAFKKLAEWGIKRTFIMPLWESIETEVLPRFKGDRERFGKFGNMCCPLSLEISEAYGGWEGFRDILRSAVESGLETYTWFGSHFSSLSALQSQIHDLWSRDVTGQINRNNYGHLLFAANQNSGAYQEYLFNAFKRAKEYGLTGIFRDSHCNMASDTINYRQCSYEKAGPGATADQIDLLDQTCDTREISIESMHDTEISIMRRFQNDLGLLYYVESPGMIGTPMCGCSYERLRGCEWIYSNMETYLHLDKVLKYSDDPFQAYFRGMSVKLFYQIEIEVNTGGVSDWWNEETMVPLIRAYETVCPHMKRMRLLGQGDVISAIIWTDEKNEIIFTYNPITYKSKWLDVLSGKEKTDGQLEARKIYMKEYV